MKKVSKRSTDSMELKNENNASQPLRKHAVVLLDALVSAIDINDVVKLSVAFRVRFSFISIVVRSCKQPLV